MTDINQLTKNVIDREQAKLNEIIENYKDKVQAETDREKEKLMQEFTARKVEAEKDLKRGLDIAMNSIDLRRRDKVLSVKRSFINQYVNDVEESLEQLDEDTTKNFIMNILQQFSDKENAALVLGSLTKERLANKLNEFDSLIKVSDRTIAGEHGFVIEQGSLQYNYLFKNLVKDIRPKLEEIIVRNVFDKN